MVRAAGTRPTSLGRVGVVTGYAGKICVKTHGRPLPVATTIRVAVLLGEGTDRARRRLKGHGVRSDPMMATVLPVRHSRQPPSAATAVVLVHGYLCVSRLAYWQGMGPLRRELVSAGCPSIVSCVPRTGGVAARAGKLARGLAKLPHRRLILVGHSMGGLDARYVASRLDPARRISHVVTIGTPHRGTAIAEWALRDRVWLTRLLRLVDRGALRDLSPEGAARLDEAMPDRPDVGYLAVAGSYPAQQLAGAFRRLAEQVAGEEGPNDGVVSLRSACRWAEPSTVAAHHLELIGHPFPGGVRRPVPPPAQPATSVLGTVLDRLLGVRGPATGPA
jgi:triacylglycerol lipase